MEINKVDAFGETLIDLTEDSVTPSDLPQGVTAHNSAGEQITGTKMPTQHRNIFYANAPGWYRVGEGIRRTPISFIFSITKNYNNTNTCMGAVLVALANRVSKNQITQLYYLSENQDIPQIRIVNEGGADDYNIKFYLDVYYGNTFANMFGAMVKIIGSVYLEENYFQLYSGDEIIKDPIVADENYITEFEFNQRVSGLVADATVSTTALAKHSANTDDELDNVIDAVYNAAKDDSTFEFFVGINVGGLSLGGGTWLIKGMRANASYGYLEATIYNNHLETKPIKRYRNKYNSVWGSWISE